MLNKILQHPFIGTGFNKTLTPDSFMLVDYQKYGPVMKHNDYGALGMALGIMPVIAVIIFLCRTYSKIYKSKLSILLLMVMIAPFFQSTMFNAYNAVVFLTIIGVCLAKGELHAGKGQ